MRAMGELLLTRHDYRSFADFVGEYRAAGQLYPRLDLLAKLGGDPYRRRSGLRSYIQYWFPELSAWMPALSMLAILFLLNLLSVKMFGEAEFCVRPDQGDHHYRPDQAPAAG